MKQYRAIKAQYPDCILFFRLGDFYEMFDDDARVASEVLQIALTTRDKGKEDPVPMCGVPHFAADTYISKLVKAGYKVAICEQVEDPSQAKGIVQREVVKVITPGTHLPDNPKENAFVLSFYPSGKDTGIAVADLSTGEFWVYETRRALYDELQRHDPKEVLCPASLRQEIHISEALKEFYVTEVQDWLYDYQEAYRSLTEHYRVYSLEAFGIESMDAAVSAAGALLRHLKDNLLETIVLRPPQVLNQSGYMFLDSSTKRNLELVRNLKDQTERWTLLEVLDETLTPMGGRFLRQAILRPLLDLEEIQTRLQVVEEFYTNLSLLESLRTHLRKIQDLERLTTKVLQGSAGPRDLVAIKNSLEVVPALKQTLQEARTERLAGIRDRLKECQDLRSLIHRAIVEDPPQSVRDGDVIREGFSEEIDELRQIARSGKDYIARMEEKERQRTRIPSLKIGYNKVFGYYIEVTKPNLHLVPPDYIRKQTLVNAERFITEELKNYENRVLGAEEKLKALEAEVFRQVVERAQAFGEDLVHTARAVAEMDFLLSLAVVARRYNYVRPEVDNSLVIEIEEGRHPVLERMHELGRFIPNSTYMDGEEHLLHIITGPNMAGKSTYMRQVALIVLMAQMGSFVPATRARIGLVDRVFTRIGASDFLAHGQSTFMVEMIETANILHNATDRSLIILDEVGRGTSTFDGISIAWATAEYILKHLKARTLFATHYHELTDLALEYEGVKNFNVAVKEWGEEIIFLRRVERGPSDKSYGIHVAQLAGLPREVVERAKEVLKNLEQAEVETPASKRMLGQHRHRAQQLDLFSINYEPLIEKILKTDIQGLTPEKALKRLKQLKALAEEIVRFER